MRYTNTKPNRSAPTAARCFESERTGSTDAAFTGSARFRRLVGEWNS
jgi:hypothetical protein